MTRLVVWVVRKNNAAKPRSMNVPVPRSNVRDLRMAIPLQKRGSDQIIQEQDEHGGCDYGARGRATDTLGRGRRIITLVHRDQAACDAENATLDDALVDVPQADGSAHLRPEAACIDTHDLHSHERRSIDA